MYAGIAPDGGAGRDAVLSQRWAALCRRLGLGPAAAARREGDALLAAYREPQRAYHTLQHLHECLVRLDEAAAALAAGAVPAAADWLELALWYHDAVYRPRAGDNERRSADRAGAFLHAAGAGADARARVGALIMSTRHDSSPAGALQQWMVDIDLSILGAAPQRFAEYDRQVRREYRWVPWFVYRRRRRELLQGLLQRPRLYATDFFHRRLETRARDNLSAAVRRLQKA